MADRTTKVTLTAQVEGYMQGMQRAGKATRELGNTSAEAAAKAQQQREAFDVMGRSLFAIGAIATASVALAVKAFADFDAEMSNVQAATGETDANMDLLGEAAMQAGRDTAFGAGEAAGAITELAKAGVATADILDGALVGALDLAAAGEIDVARAAEIAATAMTQFGIEGSKVPHIADLLASGANKAQGGVEELSQALNQAGLVSAAAGLSIEETVGGLSAFASAGLLGSDAGTSFKAMLQRLTPISAEAEREMNRLGISAFDAQGEFIGLEGFAGNLQESLKDLTPEQRAASQAIIFGTDAVRASNVLYEQGADGIAKWVSEVDDSGAAARTAAEKLNNLSGDLRILQGSIETSLIASGSGANEILREMAQAATFLVNTVGDMPQPMLDAGLAVGTVVGAVGLAGGASLLAVPKVAAFRVAISAMGISGRTAAIRIVGMGGALAAATILISAFVARQADAAATTTALRESLDKGTGALTNYSRELVVAKLAETGAFETAKEAGVSQRELTDAIIEGGEAFDLVDGKIQDVVMSNVGLSGSAVEARDTVRGLRDSVKDSQAQFENAEKATDSNAEALEAMDTAAANAESAVDDLADTLANFGKVQLDARAAARDFESAVDDATASVAENGRTLDISTEAGRANQSALDDIALSTNELASQTYAQTGSMEDATAALEAGREKYIAVGEAMGLTRDEAIEYADALIATPATVETQVKLTGIEEARARLSALAGAYLSGGSVSLRAVVNADSVGRENGGIEEYANGGMREGIYRGRPGGIIKFAEENTDW